MSAVLVDALTGLGGLTITVRHDLEPASQKLMDTLGVQVIVDPSAPRCARDTEWADRPGRRACTKCAAIERQAA